MSEQSSPTVATVLIPAKSANFGGIAAYLVAIASLFPVLPWLYIFSSFNYYHALIRERNTGPTRRTDIFIFFSQGWWVAALGVISGTIGLAFLGLFLS